MPKQKTCPRLEWIPHIALISYLLQIKLSDAILHFFLVLITLAKLMRIHMSQSYWTTVLYWIYWNMMYVCINMYVYIMHSMHWKMHMHNMQCSRAYRRVTWEYPFMISWAVDASTGSLWKLPFYFALFSIGKCSLQRIQQVLNEAFRAVHKREWIKPHNSSVQYRRHPHLIRKGSHLWKAAAV